MDDLPLEIWQEIAVWEPDTVGVVLALTCRNLAQRLVPVRPVLGPVLLHQKWALWFGAHRALDGIAFIKAHCPWLALQVVYRGAARAGRLDFLEALWAVLPLPGGWGLGNLLTIALEQRRIDMVHWYLRCSADKRPFEYEFREACRVGDEAMLDALLKRRLAYKLGQLPAVLAPMFYEMAIAAGNVAVLDWISAHCQAPPQQVATVRCFDQQPVGVRGSGRRQIPLSLSLCTCLRPLPLVGVFPSSLFRAGHWERRLCQVAPSARLRAARRNHPVGHRSATGDGRRVRRVGIFHCRV
jgi:hypothetical protein